MKTLIGLLPLLLIACKGPEIKVKAHILCRVAGFLPAGADCANDQTSAITQLSYRETLEMLEPQPDRLCVPVPEMNICRDDPAGGKPVKLLARPGADLISDEDFTDLKTVLEQACAELRDRCSPETKARLAALTTGRKHFRK